LANKFEKEQMTQLQKAASNGAAGEGNEAKILRDKAFTLLDEKARIIRENGQYVFWKDENKLKRYYA